MIDRYKIIATIIFVIAFLYLVLGKNVFNDKTGNPNSTNLSINYDNEIVLIHIGSSTCPYCNSPEFLPVISETISNVKNLSDSLGYGFKVIGVTTDKNPYEGIEYLKKFKNLDEISVGSGYNNIVVDKYMWKRDISISESGVPQILILKRSYTSMDSTNLPFKIVNSEKILDRRVGVNSIISFNNNFQNIEFYNEILIDE